ncbi:hypothetical protein [Rheinheimera salexigens]|uniref:Uncharacterized protein n=1 Tax=Rheinheimera salexigens TaxID=1628148 RepID=A0A1E7Q3I9_9GAMM|nr:hypothetical protein [Rheinheimera salexigens]OEY68709.1 hypothetical protein BI198_03330 [Rheinheimera salexigens]
MVFNQYFAPDNEQNDTDITQIKQSEKEIKFIEDQFIEKAEHDFTDRLQLLAADIYRRRGEFTQALMCLNRVSSETNTFKVVCQRKWINEQSTKLEMFPSYYDRQEKL